MSEPTYTQATERIYSRLPEIVRSADELNDYSLKRYISTIADVEDQVERLIARLTYLTLEERAESDYAGDYGYDGLPYSYFQTTDSRNSAKLTANNNEPVYLRTAEAYRVIPGSVIYVGAVFRTDRYETLNSYGLRLWYYNAAMELVTTRDVGIGNGSKGATWVAQNAQDTIPTNAYYVRVSPFGRNTSGAISNIWVDDVYVRSHYEVVATMNLLGSGHNFALRAEQELISGGDFDLATDLSVWDLSENTSTVDHSLDGVPEIQSHRVWLSLATQSAGETAYARQRVGNISPSSTYTFSMYIVKDGSVANDDIIRVTFTPDTGGPSVHEYVAGEFQTNIPSLVTLTWNSPETISGVIVNIERVSPTTASSGFLVNDISLVRFRSDISQIDALGSPVTREVNEYEGRELFASSSLRSAPWVRYATMTDPDREPLPADAPDPSSSVSFIEREWRHTKPGNTYTFSGEIFSTSKSEYVDLTIWYRLEGKGWGDAMLHRIYAPQLGAWVPFERSILIPEEATEFRVNVDLYKSGTSSFNLRALSLKALSDQSWYMLGSRPFSFDGFSTKPISYLSDGDLVSYTASVSTTGSTSGGYVGIRVYNGNEVIHESLVRAVGTLRSSKIVGAFQVPEDNAELRISAYVNDPTPFHQAAYFFSDLEVVYTSQQYTETPRNFIENGGFEVEPITDDWEVLIEKVTAKQHGQTAINYTPPVNPGQYLSVASGYNAEDVPDRPAGLPLGATSDLVDPRTANSEWLPWLSQFVGKNISQFSSLESARSAMASGTSFSAGTIGAIQDAVQAVLGGTKTVRIFPMTTDLSKVGEATQWDISIVTRTSESPDISVMEEAVRLRNAKPAGVVFHFHKHQSTWDVVELANPTWDVWDTRTWTQVEESGLGN